MGSFKGVDLFALLLYKKQRVKRTSGHFTGVFMTFPGGDQQQKLQDVTGSGQNIHITSCKTTTCCFYTSGLVRNKQMRYYMLTTEL